jgi:hypothetical protein
MTQVENLPTTEQEDDVFKGLPRRILIGPYAFRISIVDEGDPVLDGNDGMSVIGKFRIYLPRTLAFQRCAEVVHHEISHCVNWVYGVGDDSSEEHFVTQNSKGVVETRLRNPRLDNWMNKTLRRMRKESNHA